MIYDKTKAPPRLAKVTIQRVMPKVRLVMSTKQKENVFTQNKQMGQLACIGIIGVDVKSDSQQQIMHAKEPRPRSCMRLL